MSGLSWFWIGVQLSVAPVVGLLVAYPFWRKLEPILGNVVGAMFIACAAIALIFREYVEVNRIVQACIDAGSTCWPKPSAETRFAIYACVGILEVLMLFGISLSFERRIRNRAYAAEWRR